ncbi:hypothetical protein BDN70DRAFT_308106 [Pholiota conissans]|uniref:Uncharacterized protein n=1 Tax=Pholiota conissans TaxID=109636 RepID=A0A9P5YVF7_9AGAR|nr:hypothetical protein BDN70DRAFT_308106 [Pholiota conissans]
MHDDGLSTCILCSVILSDGDSSSLKDRSVHLSRSNTSILWWARRRHQLALPIPTCPIRSADAHTAPPPPASKGLAKRLQHNGGPRRVPYSGPVPLAASQSTSGALSMQRTAFGSVFGSRYVNDAYRGLHKQSVDKDEKPRVVRRAPARHRELGTL